MSDWQLELEQRLSLADAPAALDRGLLERFAAGARGSSVAPSTLSHWINRTEKRKRLQRVSRGVYLNLFRSIAGTPPDAAHLLRRDAIVSLNTVLGDCGVLNNPSNTVTAVIPLDVGGTKPPRGRFKTQVGWYHFFAMPRAVLEAGAPEDRIDATYLDHVRATPERALIDWLYLARSRLSHRTWPNPGDLDLELLDHARLDRLVDATGLQHALERYR